MSIKFLKSIFSSAQCVYLGLLCVLWAIPFWPRGLWWLADLIVIAPLWVLFIPLVLFLLTAIFLKDGKGFIMNALSCAVIVFGIMGFNIPLPHLGISSGGSSFSLKMITVNTGGVKDPDAFLRMVVDEKPDVIAFQELSAPLQARISPGLKKAGLALEVQGGLGVASTWKIRSMDMNNSPFFGRNLGGVATCVLETPAGLVAISSLQMETLREGVEAVMDRSPNAVAEMRRVTDQQEQQSRVATDAARCFIPVIVAGDFNMPASSPIYKSFWSEYADVFVEKGFGLGYTKHTRWYGVRIDRIIHDANWKALEARVGPDIGGDHHPVVARLVFTGQAAPLPESPMRDGQVEAATSPVQAPAVIPLRKVVAVEEKKPVLQGQMKVPVIRLQKDASSQPILVSTGIPFAKGQLSSENDVSFFKEDGQEIAVAVRVLARWPDASIRSLLVQFPFQIPEKYEYITMQWGRSRTVKGLDVVEPSWQFPAGMMLLPAPWLCASEVSGPQVPFGQTLFPGYDANIEKHVENILAIPWKGKVSEDLYYDLPHVLYQLYIRTGDVIYFLYARRELLYYRKDHVIHEGPKKGQSTDGTKTRYLFVQAMADDYFLTGDRRSLDAAGEMVGYMEQAFTPDMAFYAKTRNNFWTEREAAFPLIGFVTYYEMTGDPKYLEISREIVQNLHKTQKEWPGRGGFIHNLYAHDPEEGARPDEYGGSPFMTGLLLEGIVEFHRLTDDDTAADSIFRALEWLMREGMGTADAIKYLTADKYSGSQGEPDLNMLVAQAFAYGYKISGFTKQDILDTGVRLFKKGVSSAYLAKRKHFAQNYRSSGHFLAYVQDAPVVQNLAGSALTSKTSFSPVLLYENFDGSSGGFKAVGRAVLAADLTDAYAGKASLKVASSAASGEFGVGRDFLNWNISNYSVLLFACRIPRGLDVVLRARIKFDDWVALAATKNARSTEDRVKDLTWLQDDDAWHEVRINVSDSVKSLLADVSELKELQLVVTGENSDRTVHIDEFKVSRP